jgi:hypothetical protein
MFPPKSHLNLETLDHYWLYNYKQKAHYSGHGDMPKFSKRSIAHCTISCDKSCTLSLSLSVFLSLSLCLSLSEAISTLERKK